REPPLCGTRRDGYRFDLGQAGTEKFLQMRLDSQMTDLPVGCEAVVQSDRLLSPSWPGSSRPSTSFLALGAGKTWMPGKAGHDELTNTAATRRRFGRPHRPTSRSAK